MASRWFLSAAPGTGVIESFAGAAIGIGLIAWSSKDDNIPSPGDTPLPLSDGELDWINRWVLPLPLGFNAAGDDIFFQNLDDVHLSKAKRRLGSDNGILIVAETKLVTNFWSISADVRCLIKE
jgi:hypothetical protein